jgi:hypothetical protein
MHARVRVFVFLQVRHAEAEAARMRTCVQEAEQDALLERKRADGLVRTLLNIQVRLWGASVEIAGWRCVQLYKVQEQGA